MRRKVAIPKLHCVWNSVILYEIISLSVVFIKISHPRSFSLLVSNSFVIILIDLFIIFNLLLFGILLNFIKDGILIVAPLVTDIYFMKVYGFMLRGDYLALIVFVEINHFFNSVSLHILWGRISIILSGINLQFIGFIHLLSTFNFFARSGL